MMVWLAGAAFCLADDFGDISVTADSMYSGNTFHGYAAIRVLLENHSDQHTHYVTLAYPNNAYGYGNSISRLSRSLTLAPGSREVTELLQPPLPISGDGSISVQVDGYHAGDIRAPNANNHCSYSRYYGSRTETATVFISRSLDFDAVGRIWDVSTTAPSYSTPRQVLGLRAEQSASAWSGNWLAYTPFDAITVQSSDLASMSSETLEAIGSYIRAGGVLLVLGATDLPPKWRYEAKDSQIKGEQYDMGFGHCYVFPADKPSALDGDSISALRNSLNSSAGYWRALPTNSANANGAMPLVENLQIPVRGIVLVMLLFVVVIGPVNIGVLVRRKRRTWMLWTIPAISFAATLMVFAYSFLREGITPTVRIAGVTYLDQSSHEAETIGAEGFYCPLTPSGGLHFDSETEATPLVEDDYHSGSSREVDWTQAQHLGSGWVVARVPAFFHVRKAETRRERLQIENKGGQLRVINGLGATIKAVWFADSDGKIYMASNVGAGGSAELTQSKAGEKNNVDGPEMLLHDIGFMENVGNLEQGAPKYLKPNTYIAELNGNPFMENALRAGSNTKLTKTSGVVYGTLDAGDHL